MGRNECTDVVECSLSLVSHIEPEKFRTRCEEILVRTDPSPGELAADIATYSGATTPLERGGAVHLFYAGMNENRRLVHEAPWEGQPTENEKKQANIDILASEILVAQAKIELRKTHASELITETLQKFAKIQTQLQEGQEIHWTDRLEVSVYTVGVLAGLPDEMSEKEIEEIVRQVTVKTGGWYERTEHLAQLNQLKAL